jgi:hypothetical protein
MTVMDNEDSSASADFVFAGEVDPSDHDRFLAYTQQARLKLIARVTRNDGFGVDTKLQGTVLKALDGIDRQSLTIKKISSDEGVGNRQAAAVEVMAKAFTNPQLFKALQDSLNAAIPDQGPRTLEIADDAETITIIPGELGQIGQGDNYDSFMARVRESARTE